MTYQLYRRQVVGGTVPEVFAFFKDPHNLEAITPPWLGFRILEATDREVQAGTRIRYQLRLHGIPMSWESRIAEYAENRMFADEQVTGPYRRWYHRHLFHEAPGGVAIEDIVEYRLPFGILGRLAHVMAVRRQLRGIFDYRGRCMAQRFPPQPAAIGQAVMP